MKRYETILILDPDLSEEGRTPVVDKINDLITQQEGLLILKDEWGTRKLAYEIKKKSRGHYIRFDYCGNGLLVDEIERSCRIDDRALKYMTVLTDEEADIDQIKKEMEDAEAEKKAAEQDAIQQETVDADPVPAPAEDAAPADTEAEEPLNDTEDQSNE